MVNEADVKLFSGKCAQIFEQVKRDIVGQEEVVENTVIAMIAGGNVLLEGVPGVGKTRLVRSMGRVFSLPFSRIQFTPDLMPADVMAGAQAMQQGVPEVAATADLDPEMLQAVAAMTNTGYIAKIFVRNAQVIGTVGDSVSGK